MKLDDLDLRISGSQHGISLYEGNNYINDYLSVHEVVLDLAVRGFGCSMAPVSHS